MTNSPNFRILMTNSPNVQNPDDKFSQFEAPGFTERGFKATRVHGTRFQGNAGSRNAVSRQRGFEQRHIFIKCRHNLIKYRSIYKNIAIFIKTMKHPLARAKKMARTRPGGPRWTWPNITWRHFCCSGQRMLRYFNK